MSEVWRDINGYEGLYQVSSEGRVKSLARVVIRNNGKKLPIKERVLKPMTDRYGYLLVVLCAGGKPKTLNVHRLVCEAFHENPENKPEVNHINEDKADNRACNLEWSTAKENCNHGTRNERMAKGIAKALSKSVGQYTRDGELVKIWPSAIEVQRQAGFSQGNVSAAARGKLKTAYGFIWKYV